LSVTTCWTIKDNFGFIRTIKTEAYYVPDTAITADKWAKLVESGSECALDQTEYDSHS